MVNEGGDLGAHFVEFRLAEAVGLFCLGSRSGFQGNGVFQDTAVT
jgi:hypothetical protein